MRFPFEEELNNSNSIHEADMFPFPQMIFGFEQMLGRRIRHNETFHPEDQAQID